MAVPASPDPSPFSRGGLLPSFDEFVAGTQILKGVDNIHQFVFTVLYQDTGALTSPAALSALRTEMYPVLNDLLETNGVPHLHSLDIEVAPQPNDRDRGEQPAASDPVVTFTFQHDRYHCQFQISSGGFRIIRSASSLATFYDWYERFMPEALRVETTVRTIVEKATSSSLRAVHSSFTFTCNFADFRKPDLKRGPTGTDSDGPRKRNMDVLATIIPHLPQNHVMIPLAQQHFYRLDLTLSQLLTFPDGRKRNAWYYLEAPSNGNGRYIVFRAEMRNTAHDLIDELGASPDAPLDTLPFEPNYGDDFRLAILSFLRDAALEGFMFQLLENWKFDTERRI